MDILGFTNKLQEIPRKQAKIARLEREIAQIQRGLIESYNTATNAQKEAIEAFSLSIDVPFDSTADFIAFLESDLTDEVAS